MKTMTCYQLAGACNYEFHANTFEEMSELSRKHAMEMVKKGDVEHGKKMNEMMDLMKNPEEVNNWFAKVRKEFENLPDDN
jgi:hypothetical protein